MNRLLQLIIILLVAVTGPATGQHDFRGLDAGRPIRVSDAYPVEFLEVEWQIGVTGNFTDDYGQTSGMLGLEFGFARNWEVNMEVEGLWSRANGASTTGVDGVSAHIMFNPNQEGGTTPAVAVQAGITTPGLGSAGRNAASAAIGGIATRTLGPFRLHLNAGYEWLSSADGSDEWSVALGGDYALGLTGRLIAADVVLERPVNGDARVLAEIGMRIQLSRTLVLDLGLGSRMDEWSDGRPHLAVTAGLSRGFGIAALAGNLTYPNPRIN